MPTRVTSREQRLAGEKSKAVYINEQGEAQRPFWERFAQGEEEDSKEPVTD